MSDAFRDDGGMQEMVSYKPGAWYFRKAIRGTRNPEALRKIALDLVTENERLREWVRSCGLVPPRWIVTEEEAREKEWLQNDA